MLLNAKLFSHYCEENGKPTIMDWMKISKAGYNLFRSSIAFYRSIKKVIIPPSSKINLDLLMLLCQGM